MDSRRGCWRCFLLLLSWLVVQPLFNPVRPAYGAAELAARGRIQIESQPTLHILHVDSSRFPELSINIGGANWPAPLQALPAQVNLDGYELPILSDQMVQQGVQLAVAIDVNNLLVRSQSGQSHYVKLAGILYNLLAANAFAKDQDWLAAYWLTNGEPLHRLQPWTQDLDLLFNQIVENRPPQLTDTPLTEQPLHALLGEFAELANSNPQAVGQPKAILLLSAGTELAAVTEVIEAAQAQSTIIHVVELVEAEPAAAGAPGAPPTTLQELALQTGGQYLALTSLEAVAPLAERMATAHEVRVLTVRADMAAPQALEVSLTLPDDATLLASVDAATFDAAAPAPQPAAALSVPPPAQEANPPASSSAAPTAAPAPAADEPALAAPAVNRGALPALFPQLPAQFISSQFIRWGAPLLVLLLLYPAYTQLHRRRVRAAAAAARSFRAPITPRLQPMDASFALKEARPLTRFQLKRKARQPKRAAAAPQPVRRKVALGKPRPPRALPRQLNTQTPLQPERMEGVHRKETVNFEDGVTIAPVYMDEQAPQLQTEQAERAPIGHLIRVINEPHLPDELALYDSAPQIHIGRHSKHNALVINDKSISRDHALILLNNGQLYLRDNGSTSGTFLNWKRLIPGEELLLRHKDLISFGQITYEFRARRPSDQ